MNLLKKLLGLHKKPKSEHSFTDSVAVELLRAHLETKYSEKVFLAHTRIWTQQGEDMVDWRKVIIHARPIALSEAPRGGLYPPESLPEVQAEVMFNSGETSVYFWRFAWIGFQMDNWGHRSSDWRRQDAEDLPELKRLAEGLLAYRNGNEIKRQSSASGIRPGPVLYNAPTSYE